MKEKKNPLRTCLGCMQEKSKRELIRIVRTPEGNICLDTTGKTNGRGAYVCRNAACMNNICKGHKLGKAFGEQPDQSVYDRIREEFEVILSTDGGGIDG